MEILINTAHSLFSISPFAIEKYRERTGVTLDSYCEGYRNDPVLIALVREHGAEKISGSLAELEIVDIPAGTRYVIYEYDGKEQIVREEDIKWETAT